MENFFCSELQKSENINLCISKCSDLQKIALAIRKMPVQNYKIMKNILSVSFKMFLMKGILT